MTNQFISADERAEWATAFHELVRSTVAARLLGRLQPVLAPMIETLDRIDRDCAEIARLA